MSFSLIIPAAGKSSRFPGMLPKWLLTHPSGNLMLVEGLKGLNLKDADSICLVILEEHAKKYNVIDGLKRAFQELGKDVAQKLKILELHHPTNHQPETVAAALRHFGIKGAFAVKDSDNYFSFDISADNLVSVAKLGNYPRVNAPSKSYVVTSYDGHITNVVEKQVVSEQFCTGCYVFEESASFLDALSGMQGYQDLYISHIIYKLILDGKSFKAKECYGFQDWGTLEDWNAFKRQFATVFIDLDGVLLLNAGRWYPPLWQEARPIEKNVDCLNKLYDSGKIKIIITTARPGELRDFTLKQLKQFNIRFHDIIFDLPHSQRVLINDFSKTNPYPSSSAINITRDSDGLSDLLQNLLGSTLA